MSTVLLAAALLAHISFTPAAALATDPLPLPIPDELVHPEGDFTGSDACVECHQTEHRTWSRTFHRTMTQRPSTDAVRGAFDGRRVDYASQYARPFTEDGRFFMDVPDTGERRVAEVAMCVGSRRYQQYFERVERDEGWVLLRLPLLWHIEEERWLHINTVFLFPDRLDERTWTWNLPSWDRHRDRWNTNCILCHTTNPRPGEIGFTTAPRETPRRFQSEVTELGIACESCHGPGRVHVERYRDRDALGAEDTVIEDPGILHPADLDPERSIAICGQCHGQRIPHDLDALLSTGPTFRAGDDLDDHVEVMYAHTGPPPHEFEARFWGDGTARLSAYEYQGITQSPCYQEGGVTCIHCHEAHGGDPRGMIEPHNRGNPACLQCHTEMADDVPAHTHHAPDSVGSQCMDCHMPHMVYGVLAIHRSHRIEIPDPKRDGEAGRPHACTLCHVDRSLVWSAETMTELWGRPFAPPESRGDGASLELADGLASLHAGDALQRATYARALGQPTVALAPRDKGFLRAALHLTIGDAYASVRWLARLSLLSLEREHPIGLSQALDRWDHMDATVANRGRMVDTLRRELMQKGPGRLSLPDPAHLVRPDFAEMPAMRELCDLQEAAVISIGE